MAVIQTGKIIYGKGVAPKIPEGWELHESEADFLKATDQNGQRYFLSWNAAYPERIAGPGMALKEGTVYADLSNRVSLPGHS